MKMREDKERELIISFAIGVMCFILLSVLLGVFGIINFLTTSIIMTISHAFFLLPLINIMVKGVKNVNLHQNLVMITMGFVFMVLNILITPKTPRQIIVDTLESMIKILIIAYIVSKIRDTIKKEIR